MLTAVRVVRLPYWVVVTNVWYGAVMTDISASAGTSVVHSRSARVTISGGVGGSDHCTVYGPPSLGYGGLLDSHSEAVVVALAPSSVGWRPEVWVKICLIEVSCLSVLSAMLDIDSVAGDAPIACLGEWSLVDGAAELGLSVTDLLSSIGELTFNDAGFGDVAAGGISNADGSSIAWVIWAGVDI